MEGPGRLFSFYRVKRPVTGASVAAGMTLWPEQDIAVSYIYDDIFKQQGFTKIGSLCYRLQLDIWWDTNNKIQIIHFILGSRSLLKGSAASLVFSLHSNTHMTQSPQKCADAISNVVKELTDVHRYQVRQKLNGGRLKIYVEEAKEPVWMWLEEWLGGSISPCQLARFAKEFKLLQEVVIRHTMVTANENILVNGHIKEDQKLLAARVVSTMLKRLDRTQDAAAPLKDLPADTIPVKPGLLVVDGRITDQYGILPAAHFDNLYVSGSTGSGKSFTGRVIVEDVAQYEQLNILILDPRNQSVGLLVPEDRDSVLSLYPDFEMEQAQARGFPFNYFLPDQDVGQDLPDDLSELSKDGR